MQYPKINVREYPSGKIYGRLEKAVEWLNSNQKKILQDILDEKVSMEFDFDDYWGMPKSISHKLSSDEVDFLQFQVFEWFRKEISELKAKLELKEAEDKYPRIFHWGHRDIAPILEIHKSIVAYPQDFKLYRYKDNLLLVLAKNPKDATAVIKNHSRWEEFSCRSSDFKEYKEI